VFEGKRGYQILKYGSTVNGLTSESSDLDLTILINQFDIEHEVVLAMLKEALLGSSANGAVSSRYEVSS
jgi:DNA polymerase sigma